MFAEYSKQGIEAKAMTTRVVQTECKDSRLDAVAKELMRQAMQCINAKGEFHLALSESNLLDDFYARLMCDPEMRAMPWGKMHVWFFGDTTLDDSIQLAISEHSGIPEDNIHDGEMGEQVDCCLLSCDDIERIRDSLRSQCAAFLVIAKSDSAIACASDSVTHWFC